MKHLLKKHRMLSVGIFLAAVLSIIYAAILSPAGKSTGSFSEFCTTLFREEMKSNTMNLHFTLKDRSFMTVSHLKELGIYQQREILWSAREAIY